jgi:hypothetical protein
MMLRETRTMGRMTVKPHINALGERADRVWTAPFPATGKSILYR